MAIGDQEHEDIEWQMGHLWWFKGDLRVMQWWFNGDLWWFMVICGDLMVI